METVLGAFGFLVLAGLAAQVLLVLVLLKLPPFKELFRWLNHAVGGLDRATSAGTVYVVGYLGWGAARFEVTQPGANFILAFRALPLILASAHSPRCCFTGAFCPRSCAPWPGTWSAPWASAERLACCSRLPF